MAAKSAEIRLAEATGTIVAGRPMPRFERIGVAPLAGACCRIRWQPDTLIPPRSRG